MPVRLLSIVFLILLLTGCSALQSPGGRVILLVFVPAGLFAGVLWLLRRRGADRGRGRGPDFPDYDDRD